MERWKVALWVLVYSIVLILTLHTFQDKIPANPIKTSQIVTRVDVAPGLTTTTTTTTTTTPPPSPEQCSPEARRERVRRWCGVQRNVANTPFPTLAQLDTSRLKSVVRMLLVDEKHKVLYCDIAKSGSTTWKHILANNTGHYSEKRTQSIHVMRYIREKYNITQLMLLSREEILARLETYFTFIVVRHPLDRLVSAYKDKLAGGNTVYEQGLGRRIIQIVRGKNADAVALKTGRGVTFPEYLNYVTRTHMTDQHFENYQDHCHPCIIDYDYIVKLETQGVDGRYVIEEHLSGFGSDNLVNHHSNRGGATLSKHLPEFENVSREMLSEVSEVYGRDMDMFGYSVEERNGRVLAKCGDTTIDRCC